MLPASVLDTFEGVFLNSWIGHRTRDVPGRGTLIWFEGITELAAAVRPPFIDLEKVGLDRLLELGGEANTPISRLILDVIREALGNADIFPSWNRLDLAALFKEIDDRLIPSRGYSIQPEDFLHSLVARHQDEMPVLEADTGRVFSLVMPDRVETFPTAEMRDSRRDGYLAFKGVSTHKEADGDSSYWAFTAISDAVSSVFMAIGR